MAEARPILSKGPRTWVEMVGDSVTMGNIVTAAWPQVYYNVALGAVVPLAPFYGKELGLTALQTATLVAAIQPGFILGYGSFAMLSDWGFSTRTINLMGASLCTFPAIIVAASPTFLSLVLFQVLQGIGLAWMMSSMQGALFRVTDPAIFGRALGIMSILVVFGILFGLLMPQFYAAGGIPLVFTVVGVLGLLMLVYLSCCAPARMFKHDGVAAAAGVPWYRRLGLVVSVPATLALLIVGAGIAVLWLGGWAIFPQVLAGRYLLSASAIAQVFAAVQIARTVMAGPGGSLADAWPGTALVAGLAVLKVVVLLMTAQAVNWAVAGAATAVLALGVYVTIGDSIPNGGLLGPAFHKLFAAVHSSVGKGSMEEAYSMFGIFMSLGALAGPLIGGYAYQVGGFDFAAVMLALAGASVFVPAQVVLSFAWSPTPVVE